MRSRGLFSVVRVEKLLQPKDWFAFLGRPDLRAVYIGAKASGGHKDMGEIQIGKFPSFSTLHKFYKEHAVSLL